MKKLIATDFDGTIYREGQISQYDKDCIAKWRQAGYLFGYVTGRGEEFPELATQAGQPGDFYLLYNGTLMLDGEGNVLYESKVDEDTFAKLEALLAENGKAEYYYKVSEGAKRYHFDALMPDPDSAKELSDRINEMYGDKIDSMVVNGLNVNVVALGEGKAKGVRVALKHYGLPEDAAAVIGDDFNDMEMITQLDGWAVSDARPAVLEAANHTADSVGQLAEFLLGEAEIEQRLNRILAAMKAKDWLSSMSEEKQQQILYCMGKIKEMNEGSDKE